MSSKDLNTHKDTLSAEDIVSLISKRPVVDVGDGNSAVERR
jgi:hypothetical protein